MIPNTSSNKLPIREGKSANSLTSLIDTKPIEDADNLLKECEQFIEEMKSELFVLPFVPSFSMIASNVRAWRAKRRDTKLQSTYQTLQPKLAISEKALRKTIGEVVEKKITLRNQARHLLIRLEKCIDYNRELLNLTEIPLEDTRNYVNILSQESTLLKNMLNFNFEILKMQVLESNSKNQNAIRWGSRIKQNKPSAEVDLSKDNDHGSIDERLNSFRELREKFIDCLRSILEKRVIQQTNLDNCVWSLDAIKNAVKREGLAENQLSHDSSGLNNTNDNFDHSMCEDCSYSYAMACDCVSHLEILQKQALDANRRLQSIVEIREKMIDSSNTLQLDLDRSSSFSGISETNEQS